MEAGGDEAGEAVGIEQELARGGADNERVGQWTAGFAIIGKPIGEDQLHMSVGPEVLMGVKGLAVIVFEDPNALEIRFQRGRWWIFMIEHG
jgi:hypothetical protein